MSLFARYFPMKSHSSLLQAKRLFALLATLATAACGGGDGGGGPAAPPATVTISISPTTNAVDAGGSATFAATVTNATNGAVTWSASGGIIVSNGSSATWTAPFSGGPFTVTATSVAEPGKTASATVTVRVVAVTVSPDSAAVLSGGIGRFTATVANTANGGVRWTANGGSIVGDSTSNVVDWRAPVGGGRYSLTATSTADPTRSGSVSVTVAPVAVAASADSATVAAGGTRSITARVSGAVDTAVTWTASAGQIVGSGANVSWKAPAVGGVYTVTATSVIAPTIKSTVSITVTSVAVAVSAAPRAYYRGETASFTATVTGAALGRDSVTWSSTCGAITPNGKSVSLVTPVVAGSCTVSARSTLDTSKVATSSLVIRSVLLVTSTDDVSDGACNFAHCSLREAIVAANAAPDVDTLSLGSTTLPATITLTSALPVIESPMRIIGPGAAQFTLNAAGSIGAPRRALRVRGVVSVTVSGISIIGGYMDQAGGVLVEAGANVLLDQVTLRNNTASSGPGGGAAVFGGSTLRVEGSLFENNHADNADDGRGGALYAGGQSILRVTGGVVRENQGSNGGGVGAEGSGITLENVTIESNTSVSSGGGVSLKNGGSLAITGGVLRNNKSTASVGGGLIVYASNLLPTQRITLVMQDVRVENNTATIQGGGVQITRNVEATLTRVVVTGNDLTDAPEPSYPTYGGGIYAGTLVNLTIDQSTISNNRILSPITFFDSDGGAGVNARSDVSSILTITNSTISGNQSAVRGGGVFTSDAVATTIVNSTISGNSAPIGGGILTFSPATLRNVTLNANRATVAGAGVRADKGAVVRIENTLLADNLFGAFGTSCTNVGGATITSLDHNLSEDASCATFNSVGDLKSTPAGIAGVLANNGGPTLTHALIAGSAAINAGNTTTCSTTDQRGAARVGVCDIGAVEFGSTSSARFSNSAQSTRVSATFTRGAPRNMSSRAKSPADAGAAAAGERLR